MFYGRTLTYYSGSELLKTKSLSTCLCQCKQTTESIIAVVLTADIFRNT